MFARLRRMWRSDAPPTDQAPPSTDLADAAETDLRAAIQAAYIEVQKAKIDRTFRAADAVTKAAGAIATIYTGLLALVYSVGSTPPRPLPARGIAPAIFLALAFFFSVVNVGFIRRTGRKVDILEAGETWKQQQVRLVRFLQWVDRGALRARLGASFRGHLLGGRSSASPAPVSSALTDSNSHVHRSGYRPSSRLVDLRSDWCMASTPDQTACRQR